jgi:hypothetical protein
MTQLQNLQQDLKPFRRDPVSCLCLVGYTANTWTGKDYLKQLSFNIQWLVVLASN